MLWHMRRNQISSFGRNGRVHLNRPVGASVQSTTGTAEVCASALVMLDTPCSEVVWRVLATHCILQFHFSSRASPCAITFQLDSTMTGLRNGRSVVRLQTAVRDISILQSAQNSYGTQTNCFDKVNLPESEEEHSNTYRSYTSTPPYASMLSESCGRGHYCNMDTFPNKW